MSSKINNGKHSDSKKCLVYGLPIIAILISVFSLIQTWCQNIKIDKLNYQTNSISFHPKLKLIGHPTITVVRLTGKKRAVNDLLQIADSNIIIKDIPNQIQLNIKLKFENVGNVLAKVYALIWTDTLSGDDKIRSILLDKSKRENFFHKDESKEYFPFREILPGDSSVFKFDYTIQFLEDKNYTMHCFVLYSNEMGILFDTYYWARYTTKEIEFKVHHGIISEKKYIQYIFSRSKLKESQVFLEDNSSYNIYKPEIAEEILNFLEIQK